MIKLLDIRPYTGDMTAPSPNHGARNAHTIEGIVLHATEDLGSDARSIIHMRSPRSRVSCHLFVARNGRVTRLVGDHRRAWHAGISRWRGTTDVNSITLGIEIANRNDGEPFTDAQYERVAQIVAHYCEQGLSLDDVVSHGAIAQGRKTDPRGWDWQRFRDLVQKAMPQPRVATTTFVKASPAPVRPVAPRVGPKPLVRSRTFWLNVLTVAAASGAIIGQTLELAFSVGFTVPEQVMTWALFAVGVINIVLRFSTTRPVCMNPNTQRMPNPSIGSRSGVS